MTRWIFVENLMAQRLVFHVSNSEAVEWVPCVAAVNGAPSRMVWRVLRCLKSEALAAYVRISLSETCAALSWGFSVE